MDGWMYGWMDGWMYDGWWMDTYYRSSDYILQVWFESEEDFQVVQIKFDEKTFIGFRKATQLCCAADQVRGGAHQGRARLCRHRRPDHRCVGGWSKCWRGVPATARFFFTTSTSSWRSWSWWSSSTLIYICNSVSGPEPPTSTSEHPTTHTCESGETQCEVIAMSGNFNVR